MFTVQSAIGGGSATGRVAKSRYCAFVTSVASMQYGVPLVLSTSTSDGPRKPVGQLGGGAPSVVASRWTDASREPPLPPLPACASLPALPDPPPTPPEPPPPAPSGPIPP